MTVPDPLSALPVTIAHPLCGGPRRITLSKALGREACVNGLDERNQPPSGDQVVSCLILEPVEMICIALRIPAQLRRRPATDLDHGDSAALGAETRVDHST